MSKLNDLINKLCPDGVEYVKIKDYFIRLKGTPITAGKMKEIARDDGEVKIFAGGKTVINANKEDIPKANIIKVPAVIVQSRGLIDFIYYEKPFTFKNEMWAYTANNKITVKYLYYVLQNNKQYFRDSASGMGSLPQISLNITEDFKIPVLPIEIQREIVRVLDNFTDYIDCLEKELELRKKQYQYYSQKLINDDSITIFKISDLCEIKKGKTPIQKAISGDYPLVVTTTERKSCNNYQFDCSAVCIPLVSSRGHGIASLNHVYYQKGKFALGNILCAVIPKDNNLLNSRYLYYYFELKKDYALVPLMKGGANVSLHMHDIANVKIPVPPIEEQERIVKILDKFDALCNDLTTGLPAEIEARKKQYEYYRDKLLTFKELK